MAQNVVFELAVPYAFRVWRDITYQLLHDICTPAEYRSLQATVHAQLDTYANLSPYIVKRPLPRIGLASKTKSFLKSHYSTKSIPCNENDIFVPNALELLLHDRKGGCWAGNLFQHCDISHYCAITLPSKDPYRPLQFAIDSAVDSSNIVLARQSECPQALDVHEFISFGTLRSGGRLQWMNIAGAIAARSLAFEQPAVHALLMQAAWQCGPVRDVCDKSVPKMEMGWHEELSSASFGFCLFRELGSLLNSIRANWLQVAAARTIILVACRLLAFTPDAALMQQIISLLRNARAVVFKWVHELVEQLCKCNAAQAIHDFQIRLCEVAATCRATYDVESHLMKEVLQTPADVAIFIECAIVLHDNAPSIDMLSVCPELRILLDRDRRLSYSAETHIASIILLDRSGLDDALQGIWPAYHAGTSWSRMGSPNERWFVTKNSKSQCVHLNILSGRLLVDGKPIRRLPREITDSILYKRLFGSVSYLPRLIV